MDPLSTTPSGQAKPCVNPDPQHPQPTTAATQPENPITSLLKILASVLAPQTQAFSIKEEEAALDAIDARTQALRAVLNHRMRIYGAKGFRSLTEAAKILEVKPSELFEFLEKEAWVYYPHKWCGRYASPEMVTMGYLERKVVQVAGINGAGAEIEQVLVTPKGLAKLAEDMKIWKTAITKAGGAVQP